MFKTLSFICLFLPLCSCSEKNIQQEKIKSMEEKIAVAPSKTNLEQEELLNLYQQYSRQFPNDTFSATCLYKSFEIQIEKSDIEKATENLERIIEEHKSSSHYESSLVKLAELYENSSESKNIKSAEKLYNTYLKEFPQGKYSFKAELFFKPDDQKKRARISELLGKLNSDSNKNRIDRHYAKQLLKTYLDYCNLYPEDEFSPIYCFDGAKLASQLDESLLAIELWLRIFEDYKKFKYYPETVLMLAIEYEMKMPVFLQNHNIVQKENPALKKVIKFDFKKKNWLKESEKMYKYFLKKYPKHELADQAKTSLKYLGKSPNEVIADFQKKNQQSNK